MVSKLQHCICLINKPMVLPTLNSVIKVDLNYWNNSRIYGRGFNPWWSHAHPTPTLQKKLFIIMWYLSQEKQKVNVTKNCSGWQQFWLLQDLKKSFFWLEEINQKKRIIRRKKKNIINPPVWLQFFEYKEKKRIQILLLKTLLAKEVGQA